MKNLNCFLLFLGRGRSGSSLCGGLISTHPNVILAHEKEFKNFEFDDEKELYQMLFDATNQKQFIWKPLRELSTWRDMKKYNDIRVIGTKKQGTLIENLKSKLSIPVKFINIYRNPFDNISTIYNKSQWTKHVKRGTNMKSIDKAISYYFTGIKMTQEVINREITLNIKHENVVTNTGYVIEEICSFLNIPIIEDHVKFCEMLVWDIPRTTRDSICWSEENISRVVELKNNYDFLKEYEWESL